MLLLKGAFVKAGGLVVRYTVTGGGQCPLIGAGWESHLGQMQLIALQWQFPCVPDNLAVFLLSEKPLFSSALSKFSY